MLQTPPKQKTVLWSAGEAQKLPTHPCSHWHKTAKLALQTHTQLEAHPTILHWKLQTIPCSFNVPFLEYDWDQLKFDSCKCISCRNGENKSCMTLQYRNLWQWKVIFDQNNKDCQLDERPMLWLLNKLSVADESLWHQNISTLKKIILVSLNYYDMLKVSKFHWPWSSRCDSLYHSCHRGVTEPHCHPWSRSGMRHA